MSTCPECYDDIGCTCEEDRKIKQLERELAEARALAKSRLEQRWDDNAEHRAENVRLREALEALIDAHADKTGEDVNYELDNAKQALAKGGECEK